VIVIGVGNELRRDDAAGIVAARRLSARGLAALEHGGEPAGLVELWAGADEVVLIDAVSSGAPPGTIHRLDASASPLPRELLVCSTHALGMGGAVELARALGRLPPRVLVYGIEGRDFAAGVGLSAEVERAVGELVEELAVRLTSRDRARRPPSPSAG
jgi:hydrogenase maturation protease